MIDFYQKHISGVLRFLFGPGCRYSPTCSQYSKEAFGRFGVYQGGILTLKRVFRCHPFSTSNYLDPVPEKTIHV